MRVGYRAKIRHALRRLVRAVCPHYRTTLIEYDPVLIVECCSWCGLSEIKKGRTA